MKTLLKTAEKRQQLHERRIERKVQKERDEENGEFDDKGKSLECFWYKSNEISGFLFDRKYAQGKMFKRVTLIRQ